MDKRPKRVFGNTSKPNLPAVSDTQLNLDISSTSPQKQDETLAINDHDEYILEQNIAQKNLNSASDNNFSQTGLSAENNSYIDENAHNSVKNKNLENISFSEQSYTDIYTCPVCSTFSGNVSQINLHLNTVHFNLPKDSSLNIQDDQLDIPFNDVRESLFGFFRITGQKVKGFGDVISAGMLSSELERFGIIDTNKNVSALQDNGNSQYNESLDGDISINNKVAISNLTKPLNQPEVCSFNNCLGPFENSARQLLNTSLILNPKREAEMSVVPWEDDKIVKSCHLCQESLNFFPKRKHHCRLCGKIVCGKKSCSSIINVPLLDKSYLRKNSTMNSRACTSCIKYLIALKERQKPTENSQLETLYNNLCSIKKQVQDDLIQIKQLLTRIITSQAEQSKAKLLQQANIERKNLQKLLNAYDNASKEIFSLPKTKNIEKRLYDSIRQSAVISVQTFTLELSSISQSMLSQSISINPKHKKESQSNFKKNTILIQSFDALSVPKANLEDENKAIDSPDMPPQLPHRVNSNLNPIETNKKSNSPTEISNSELTNALFCNNAKDNQKIKEQLRVLREQRQLVQGYIKNSTQKREWETVQILTINLDDLDKEISTLEKSL
ncbi:hypothetical protein BB561_003704 [Smittium simulii]|uniref:FYVE-type domain-containing protein n=1 Tax=Smittium simulii TaxID=133385 RepID=A0A2T9YJZ1_9FUNG|nr:hypothetical protein BB561_003704 [Smittium simulii]